MQIFKPSDSVYLATNVMMEPLFDRWYAWSHLIPPLTAARNITHRHLPIMNSYLSAPQVHEAAVKNPKMLGGPFIDYQGGRIAEITELKNDTLKRCAPLIDLSNAIQDLDDILRMEARGGSLQPLYPKVPSPLQGLVELVYDLNDHASFRLIEPLVYRSSHYMPSLQSILMSVTTSDDRPFTLSTPRLDSADALTLSVPFSDPKIDFLAQLKYRPHTLGDVFDRLALNESDSALFKSFLTTTPPPPHSRYEGRGVRWRYFGHACILLETPCCSILFDPVISYSYDNDLRRYTYTDLPASIDYVVITHNHQDHILIETLLQLRHRINNIIVPRASGTLHDPSLRLLLEAAGFANIIELAEMETFGFEGGTITGIPFLGEHSDLDIRSKLGYVVKAGRHSLLFAADSCNIEPKLYARIHQVIGDVDVLFLGMECDGAPLSWLYGPLLTHKLDRAADQSRRLSGSNYDQGVQIVRQFRFKQVYIYAMGQEPWLNYIMSVKYSNESNPIIQSNKLLHECRIDGLKTERLYGEKELFIEDDD